MTRPRALRLPAALLAALLLAPAGCGGRGDALREDTADSAGDTATTTAPRATGGDEFAYVSNEGSGEISVIDVESDSVIGTIDVGTRPRGVRVTPDGRRVYVALSGSPRCPPTMPDAECAKLVSDKSKDGIAEIDATTRRVLRVLPGGSDPEQFDLSPDGSQLYVSNEDVGKTTIVDVASGKVTASIAVGDEPEGVKTSPDGRTVYVTSESDNSVHAIDAATGRERRSIAVGKRPRDIAFLPDGSALFVSNESGASVTRIDAVSGAVAATIALPEGSLPMGLAVSPDAVRLYVATGRGGEVLAIDTRTNEVVGRVKVGRRPWGIALTRDGDKLYVANGPSHDVSVVDVRNASAMRVVKTLPVGQLAWGVAVGPAPGAPAAPSAQR